MNQNLTANENEDKKTTMEKMTEECLEEANEFYSIYERYERNAADLLNHLYPIIVNLAFANELYFKKLIMQHFPKKNIRTHKYTTLFRMLPSKDKEWLTQKWEAEHHEELEKCIKMGNNAFNEWRYAYEKEKLRINVSFLEKLAKILKERAEQQ